MSKTRLQIIPLGGLGEIGKNMTVFRYGDEIIVIDAGMAFPDETMPGIDIVIPDFSYLIENRDKVKAILITHGHEDHIGSLSYLLRDVKAPVYATRLTCGLIEGKLKEAKVNDADLHVVKSGDEFKAGSFKFGFFHVCHSIPDSCGIYLRTPVGTIVHTGDFKFDHSPVDGEQTDMYKLAELGHRGVLALCADSTNAQNPGYTPSEAVVAKSLMSSYADAKGRIILATFASNVSRIQMAVDAALAFKRKVCVFGRSMVNVVGIAREMGYLKAPEGTFIEPEELNRYRDDRICILTTGSQGEPMAGLSRMADGSHRQVQIHAGDTVIISASPIPGNENSVGRTIDNLMRLGAHACQLRGIRLGQYGRASQSFAAEVGAARVVRVVDPYAGFLVGLVQADEFDVEQRIEFTLAALPVPLPVACGRVKVVDADYLDVFRHSPVEGVGQCVESAEGVRCVEVGVDAHLLYLMLGIGLTEFAHGSLLGY